jgi:hypothetical protein
MSAIIIPTWRLHRPAIFDEMPPEIAMATAAVAALMARNRHLRFSRECETVPSDYRHVHDGMCLWFYGQWAVWL